MGIVSLPVFVFCGLGWYDPQSIGRPGPRGTQAPWPKSPARPIAPVHPREHLADRVPCKPAEGENRARFGKQAKLALEERSAASSFLRQGSIVRRSASHRGRQVEGRDSGVHRSDARTWVGSRNQPRRTREPGTLPIGRP